MVSDLSARVGAADLVCLSHLSWDFVYQRPNHLMARAAQGRRVFFVQEAHERGSDARLEATETDGLTVVRPIVPEGLDEATRASILRQELDQFLASEGVAQPWLWYYTPMAVPWTEHIDASAVIYDCMDELSGFKFAPPALRELEQRLLRRADVVFTGGRSLYEAKRDLHPRTFLFPSSVDSNHFRQARVNKKEPADQAAIGEPRIGYFGVIDERIELDLIAGIAQARPDWQLVMVGPVLKISDDELPRADNIHWLGLKQYEELPAYLGGWDVAIMPFALNESTRHISPTKTPEYLSGGRPVVSTPINDVVHPYGDEGLVHIAQGTEEFVSRIEDALAADRDALIARADRFMAGQSWDATWQQMERRVEELRRTSTVVLPPLPRRDTPLRVPSTLPAAVPAAGAASAAGDTGLAATGATRARPR